MAKIFIGTSGFTYQHWKGLFYPQDLRQKDWLEYYTKYFETVEINASFYHQMPRKVYENWRARTPKDFLFSVKGSRFITHIKRLKDCRQEVERFLTSAFGLEEKLAVVLWQLPPRWTADPKRLKEFLDVIGDGSSPPRVTRRLNRVRHAFEFRDKSWLDPQIWGFLKDYRCALVIQDSPSWPTAEVTTCDFTYLRFHGRQSLYGSCYNKAELEAWAEKIKKLAGEGLDVFVYFNNDVGGYAVRNAKELKKLLNC